jgi:hypothetical protein
MTLLARLGANDWSSGRRHSVADPLTSPPRSSRSRRRGRLSREVPASTFPLPVDSFDTLVKNAQNHAVTAAGAAIGTIDTTTAQLVNDCTFLVGGVFHKTTAADGLWVFAPAHTIHANPLSVQEQVYGLCIKTSDDSGVITMGGIATGAGLALCRNGRRLASSRSLRFASRSQLAPRRPRISSAAPRTPGPLAGSPSRTRTSASRLPSSAQRSNDTVCTVCKPSDAERAG